MNRRTFLAAAAGAAITPARIIDTHTHFYDPTRPQGVPWPPKSDPVLYRRVLPEEFVRLTKPLGITGTIVVEASPWLEDNQWVLELASRNPVIVGMVGHLDPANRVFRAHLERFAANRLFRGIRLGGKAVEDTRPEFLDGIRALAAAGLELDVLGGAPVLFAVARLTDRVESLRVVIDHLPFDSSAEYDRGLRELAARSRVYAKVSGVLRPGVPVRVERYRTGLDQLWETFGPDRLLYGSNWPVSDKVAPYSDVLAVVRDYFNSRGAEAAEKYFWKNSQTAYAGP